MTRPDSEVEIFTDERGSLLAIEFSELPFVVRRVFVVTGRPGGVDRGDHVVACAEEVVLLSGTACFSTTAADTGQPVESRLHRPGQRLHLHRGDHVRYRLLDEHSSIMVLAEHPYEPPEEHE